MADDFGALALPAPVPADGATVTDPCLDTLLAFCQAVLTADVSAAWAHVCPGKQPAEFLFTHNPTERSFNANKLPALYLYRTTGTPEWMADDFHAVVSKLRLQWVFPKVPQERQRLRDPIINGLSKSLTRALWRGRHPAWVVPGDLAQPTAIKLAVATSTSAQSYSGAALNGAVGAGPIYAARSVSVTTAPAAGAYDVADPIVVTGVDGGGNALVDQIVLTKPNGGETVSTLFHFGAAASVAFHAQTLTTGSFTIGYADSPERDLGSLVKRYAGLTQLRLATAGTAKALVIRMKDDGQRKGDAGPPEVFEMVEFDISIEELLEQDRGAFAAFANAQAGAGLSSDILQQDGSLQETFIA